MKEIVPADGRVIVIEELLAPRDLAIPFRNEAYVGVLWASNDALNASQRRKVAAALFMSGCRYIVCGGIACEAWHDDADDVLWHAEESIQDVIFYALHCTEFEGVIFSKFLILVIGDDTAAQRRIERAVEAGMTL